MIYRSFRGPRRFRRSWTCAPAIRVDLVQAVTARLLPQFADKGIVLESDVSERLPQVRADADRVEQVLTNLVGNALQYTASGGQRHDPGCPA